MPIASAAAPPTDELERQMTLAMSLNTLPPLSPLVPRVLALRGNSAAGIADLAKVIASDPMLSARIIGMANSAKFASVHPLLNVHDALMRLGFDQGCELAISVAMSRSLVSASAFKPARRDLWLHSLGVALCARQFARLMPHDCNPDAAYLAGFLHDIGYLAIMSLWPQAAHALIAHHTDPARWDEPNFVHEQGWSGHGVVGGELCRLWKLPDEVCLAVWHHDGEHGDASALGSLDMAIALAHRAADGVLPLDHEVLWRPALPLSTLLRVSGLAPAALDGVRAALEAQVGKMVAYAGSI